MLKRTTLLIWLLLLLFTFFHHASYPESSPSFIGMANRTTYPSDSGDRVKRESIHRWLQDVKDPGASKVQPPFNARGEPLYRDATFSNRPQFFTYDELELERSRRGNTSPDVESPILAPKPARHGSVKILQKPPNSPSKKGSGRDVFVGIDSTGRKVATTSERVLSLQSGEEIDPSGGSVISACPTNSGRHRALSRSDAVKRPTSPYAGDYHGLGNFKSMTSHPREDRRPDIARLDKPARECNNLLGVPSQGSRPRANTTGLTRSSTRAANPVHKPRVSKFAERL